METDPGSRLTTLNVLKVTDLLLLQSEERGKEAREREIQGDIPERNKLLFRYTTDRRAHSRGVTAQYRMF